jgi:hypothetical protein
MEERCNTIYFVCLEFHGRFIYEEASAQAWRNKCMGSCVGRMNYCNDLQVREMFLKLWSVDLSKDPFSYVLFLWVMTAPCGLWVPTVSNIITLLFWRWKQQMNTSYHYIRGKFKYTTACAVWIFHTDLKHLYNVTQSKSVDNKFYIFVWYSQQKTFIELHSKSHSSLRLTNCIKWNQRKRNRVRCLDRGN